MPSIRSLEDLSCLIAFSSDKREACESGFPLSTCKYSFTAWEDPEVWLAKCLLKAGKQIDRLWYVLVVDVALWGQLKRQLDFEL